MAKKAAKKASKKAAKKASKKAAKKVLRSETVSSEARSSLAELESLRGILIQLRDEFRMSGVGLPPGAPNPYDDLDPDLAPLLGMAEWKEYQSNQIRKADRLMDKHLWRSTATPRTPCDAEAARRRGAFDWGNLESFAPIIAWVDDRIVSFGNDGLPSDLVDDEFNAQIYQAIPLGDDSESRQSSSWIAERAGVPLALSTIKARLGRMVEELDEVRSIVNGRSGGYWKTRDRRGSK